MSTPSSAGKAGSAGLRPRHGIGSVAHQRKGGDPIGAGAANGAGGDEAPRSRPCPRSRPSHFRGWYSRGYLPHRDDYGVLQSITYRLADSLPQKKLRELEEWLSAHKAEDEASRSRLETLRRIQIEKWIDAGMGCCALRHPALAEVVENAFLHHDGIRYSLLEWCVMPNHVHALIKPLAPLDGIARSWKGFTGYWACRNNAKLGLGIPGTQLWHPDAWDRYIRDAQHYRDAVDYIRNNPVKAGLCTNARDWRWSSARLAEERE